MPSTIAASPLSPFTTAGAKSRRASPPRFCPCRSERHSLFELEGGRAAEVADACPVGDFGWRDGRVDGDHPSGFGPFFAGVTTP